MVGTPAEIKTPSNPEGLDRVAPYQNRVFRPLLLGEHPKPAIDDHLKTGHI
jgi:hypothetical protein